jgi:hypothetical protein
LLDEEGEEVPGTERPERLPLKSAAAEASSWLNDARWSDLNRALQTPLFETPIAHFFVKAFLEDDPLDEFLAHITTIEAALLLEEEKTGLTKLVARRVSALLGSAARGAELRKALQLQVRVCARSKHGGNPLR